jgi:wyosine [tRNA(Phe)-imidazoG37] synthetase (radical SAM superfamily)
MTTERRAFYEPEDLKDAVARRVAEARTRNERIDYLAFVPDGEPALDVNLGAEIDLLKTLGIKIGVITNASLLWQEGVRNDLRKADWVSLKIDSVNDAVWRQVNRPVRSLRLATVLEGVAAFARAYSGRLVTETMLVHDVNTGPEELAEIASFVAELAPAKSYLSIPTRPPAERWAQPPTEYEMTRAYHIFKEIPRRVECLTGYEGNAFARTGNAEDDLLSITSVHPMREDGVAQFLKKADADWRLVKRLLEEDKIVEIPYGGAKFYVRNLVGKRGKS